MSTSELAARDHGRAREPVLEPRAIQPHGVLLVIGADGRIHRASSNSADLVGLAPHALIGQPLTVLLATGIDELVGEAVADERRWRRLSLHGEGPHRRLDAFAHLSGARCVVELEACSDVDLSAFLGFQARVQRSLTMLSDAKDLRALSEAITTEVRALTGFDRVMLYRYDAQGNGSVVAEAVGEGLETYRGKHFPASDIHAESPHLSLSSRLRLIPIADYTPAPLVPVLDPEGPLEFSLSLLLGAAPVHLEYLKSMGVAAAMTVSLLRHGRPWGIIACHHSAAKLVPHETRSACELVARLASSLISVKEENEDLDCKRRLKETHAKLLASMAASEDLMAGMVNTSPNLLDLTAAEGAAAAIGFDGAWTAIGRVPSVEETEALVDWLSATHPMRDVFSTDELPAVYPPAAEFKDIASGLLAIWIPKSARNYVLWFRPEAVQTVNWAGSFQKSEQTEGVPRRKPVKSFALWKQVVHERSTPWRESELEAAADLRKSIIELDLERQFIKERAARAAAEAAIQARDHVLAVVSHDLKSPLSVIQFGARRLEEAPSRLDSVPPMIDRACRRMSGLIEDVLSLSMIEAGKFVVDARDLEANTLLADAHAMLEPLAAARSIALRTASDGTPSVVRGDPDRLMQVFSNLVGNAIKFTPRGGLVTIRLERAGAETRFVVDDSGPGIPADDLGHVFDRFWQARKTSREGAGLGLAIAKGIVEAHGGRIGVDSVEGIGSAFYFTLPRATPAVVAKAVA